MIEQFGGQVEVFEDVRNCQEQFCFENIFFKIERYKRVGVGDNLEILDFSLGLVVFFISVDMVFFILRYDDQFEINDESVK